MNFERRIKKVQDKLTIGKDSIIVTIKTVGDKEGFDLSNPVGEWMTYPEALEKSSEQNRLAVLSEVKEIAAHRATLFRNHGAAKQ